jgi:hypothetical protein
MRATIRRSTNTLVTSVAKSTCFFICRYCLTMRSLLMRNWSHLLRWVRLHSRWWSSSAWRRWMTEDCFLFPSTTLPTYSLSLNLLQSLTFSALTYIKLYPYEFLICLFLFIILNAYSSKSEINFCRIWDMDSLVSTFGKPSYPSSYANHNLTEILLLDPLSNPTNTNSSLNNSPDFEKTCTFIGFVFLIWYSFSLGI